MVCGIPMGEDAFIYATLDKTPDSINLDIHRLVGDISEQKSHSAFSMAYYFVESLTLFPRLLSY
jgi:hypothetical protein